jgi:hypothetical protein
VTGETGHSSEQERLYKEQVKLQTASRRGGCRVDSDLKMLYSWQDRLVS